MIPLVITYKDLIIIFSKIDKINLLLIFLHLKEEQTENYK